MLAPRFERVGIVVAETGGDGIERTRITSDGVHRSDTIFRPLFAHFVPFRLSLGTRFDE